MSAIRRWFDRFEYWVSYATISAAGRSRVLSDIYYLLKSDFSSEHNAVLNGRRAYYQQLEDIGASCALLRRNTHRLEKGLIMKPRRAVFAEGIIVETIECYKDAMQNGQLDIGEAKWATDVLGEYFSVVEGTPIIDAARQEFEQSRASFLPATEVDDEFGIGREDFIPYAHDNLPENDISFDQLRKLFVRRRSVRWYQDKKVPRELVEKAVASASLAPSACNRQPYRFHYCDRPGKIAKIAGSAGGANGFADNLPAIIAIVGDLSSYPKERDRHLIYVDGSLAAMQLMLALQTLGLASCSINWPDARKNELRIRKVIDLKDYERVVMLMAVGYADDAGGIPYSQKKPPHLLIKDVN
jgi:nitroreductase